MDAPELLTMLVRSFAGIDTERPVPLRLCEACVGTFHAQGGALTISAEPEDRLAVSTPGVFEQLEPLQEILGEGPVHQALAEDRQVVMRIGAAVDEFPMFSQLAGSQLASRPAAVGLDETDLHAVPMRVDDRPVGVLSLYMPAGRRTLGAAELQFAADAVGLSLLGNAELLDWSDRTPFHLATGMVVAQLGVRPDDASAVIRALAFSRSTSLRSAAQDVLERRVTFSPDG